MRVIVAGGGTGGHVFPALAIIEELQQRDPQLELWFVGKRGNIEERLTRERHIPFRPIAAGPLARGGGVRHLWALVQLAAGTVQAGFLMLRFRPDVVIGTGGYVSVPPVAVAALLRVPTIVHEQNRVPGRANVLLSRWATVVATTYSDSAEVFPEASVQLTGNPVRAALRSEAIAALEPAAARESFGLAPEVFTVFVFGGSQGARTLTQATLDALEHLPAEQVQVLLMSGAADAAGAAERARAAAVRCEVRGFIEDMAAAYAGANLVVCRAGASAIAEVTAAALPAVLVPYPYAVNDHQRKNAEAIADAGAAVAVEDAQLTGATLAALVLELAGDPARRAAMANAARRAGAPAAAEALADIVCDLAIPGKAAA